MTVSLSLTFDPAILKPELLSDKSRLQEIYDLRVIAWENSENNIFINREIFPDGWKDNFDDDALHWIIEVDNKIIASARLCIIDSIDAASENYGEFNLPDERPFAFWSRLVVLPEFRGRGITHLMDMIRIKYLKEHNISFAIGDFDDLRLKTLYNLGFKKLGLLKNTYGETDEMITTVLLLKLEDIKIN